MASAEECLNRDTGLEIPGCWMAALGTQEARTNCTNPRLLATPADEPHTRIETPTDTEFRYKECLNQLQFLALKKTSASGQNVSKAFLQPISSRSKLVPKNCSMLKSS